MPGPIRLDSFRLGILFPMNSLSTRAYIPQNKTHKYQWYISVECLKIYVWVLRGVSDALSYLNPSSPFTSAVIKPPTRGAGLPESVTPTMSTNSFTLGASGILTSMASKWDLT